VRRKVPRMEADEEVEAFLAQDLSDLDFAQFKPARFEFEAKSAQINLRVPEALLDAVKRRAKARGIPYTRYIREIMEEALSQPSKPRPAGARH
jgi:predicted DNA binding CopG/RHH family protein